MGIFFRLSNLRLLPALACLSLGFGPLVAAEEAEYRLGPGDIVSVQVWNRPELSRTTTVAQDGFILLPALDKPIVAQNRTVSELAREVTRLYRFSYPDIPEVVVRVDEYKSRSVTVLGAVGAPGTYGFADIPDLYQVLIKAGLPTPAADLTQVRILRKGEKDEAVQSIPVDMSAIRRGEVPKSLPKLLPGDTIDVPAMTSDVAVSGAKFQVLGSVRAPGVYPWDAAQTVTGALALSGGPLPEADLRRVHLTRSTPTGLVSYRLDVEALLYEGKSEANLDLEEGDTLTVPTKAFGPGTLARGLLLFVPLITTLTSLIVVIDNR